LDYLDEKDEAGEMLRVVRAGKNIIKQSNRFNSI
jgi:hypothetical protein